MRPYLIRTFLKERGFGDNIIPLEIFGPLSSGNLKKEILLVGQGNFQGGIQWLSLYNPYFLVKWSSSTFPEYAYTF